MKSTVNVGIVGLGVVGSEVAQLLQTRFDQLSISLDKPLKLSAISARDRHKDRGLDLKNLTWFDNPLDLATDTNLDIVVELIGGGRNSFASNLVKTALNAGKTVVTANKALLAEEGNDLAELAEQKATSIHFEAAVAGGISIINTLKNHLPANQITSIHGILNGTCNYILSRMEDEALSFEQSLKEAQELGYAESDPTFDIDGFDSAYKLSLLASLAFGSRIAFDNVSIEGIRHITLDDIRRASEFGYRIKLLGIASLKEGKLTQSVEPVMINKSFPLADVNGVTNAVGWKDDLLGDSLMTGPGAGGKATASAVLADIVAAAKYQEKLTFNKPASKRLSLANQSASSTQKAYYISLLIKDEPGTFARIAQAMASQGISLSSILQEDHDTKDNPGLRCVIIITHETNKLAIDKVTDLIKNEGLVNTPPVIFAIEDLA